jgi:hypothetical protein
MKLNRTPLILLAIAGLLGGFVYFYEIQGAPQREEAQQKAKQLFSFKEEEVQKLTLKTAQETFSFRKEVTPASPSDAQSGNSPTPSPTVSATTPATSPTTSPTASPTTSPTASPTTSSTASPAASPAASPKMTWRMTMPHQNPANEASIAYLLSLMATAKSEKTLKEATSKQTEFGFDQPLAIVEVTLKNQQTQRLVLGKPDFNRAFLYAQVNPPEKPGAELSVLLVPMEFENAVKRPLTEWELQPEKQTSPKKKSSTPIDKSKEKSTPNNQSTPEKSTNKSIQESPKQP